MDPSLKGGSSEVGHAWDGAWAAAVTAVDAKPGASRRRQTPAAVLENHTVRVTARDS